MQDYSVPIYEKQKGSYFFIGTGFFVTNTLFATADHVLRDGGTHVRLAGQYLAFTAVFRHYELLECAESDDLAICQLPTGFTSPGVARLAKEFPAMHASCIVAGFKKNPTDAGSPWFHEYKCQFGFSPALRSTNRIRLQGRLLHLDNGNLHSMSGGPIANQEGEVIGLLTSGGPRLALPIPNPERPAPFDFFLLGVSFVHIAEVITKITSSV